MSKVSFKTSTSISGRPVVEVRIGDEVCAAIYPNERGDGVNIISAHIKDSQVVNGLPNGIVYDDGRGQKPPIPVLQVAFEVRPYTLEGGQLTRISKH